MKKLSAHFLAALLLLIIGWSPQGCQANDKVLPIGCFKIDLNSSYIEVSSNYPYSVNLTSMECVRLCFSSSTAYKLAGLSADGICLCSLANINQSQEVSNVSCLFPSTKGFHFKLYSIPALANISVPESVLLFQDFRVNISTVNGTNCSYVLDFDDGRRVNITSNNNSVTHVYKNNGNFEVKLSSKPACLPEAITESIVVQIPLGNASLDCPRILEANQTNSSCILKVLQGSGINTTVDSSFLGTMPDTTVQNAGTPPSWFPDGKTLHPPRNETALYIWPFTAINHEGVITAFELHAYRTGNLTIQIYSPVCPADSVLCQGGCVASYSLCSEPNISSEFMNTSYCYPESSPHRNLNFSSYNVTSELSINISSTGYIFHQLSSPLPIQRYDLLGWKSSLDSAVIYFSDLKSSWELSDNNFTLGQSFSLPLIPQLLPKTPHFRIHFLTTSVLEYSLQPVKPKLVVNISVSGDIMEDLRMLSKEIKVQERISGLQIISESVHRSLNGTNYFPVKEKLEFRFNVVHGSEVRYSIDPDDGSNSSIINTNNWTHSYEQKANFLLNVTAFNNINSVSLMKNLSLVHKITNLSFTKDPKDHPGLIGVPYIVRFQLGAGDGVGFQVDFKPNVSWFLSCADLERDEIIPANFSYESVGTYPITITAFSRYLYSNDSINSTVAIKEEVQNVSFLQILDFGERKPLDTIITHLFTEPLRIRANVTSGAPVDFEFSISRKENRSDVGTPNRSSLERYDEVEYRFTRCQIGDWVITVNASNGADWKGGNISVKVIKDCGFEILARRKEEDPFRVNSGVDVKIKVEKTSRRRSNESNCTNADKPCKPVWTLFVKNDNTFEQTTFTHESDQNTFSIKKQTLPDGLYKIEMYTEFNDKTEETYVKVESSDPVAKIIGGNKRDVAFKREKELVINASTSYDPDGKHFIPSSGLSFDWSCYNFSHRSTCSLKLNNSPKATVQLININDLNVGDKYEFKLTVVRKVNGENKSDVAYQVIHVVARGIPTTEIVCKVNCLLFVVVTERLSLEGRCEETDVQFAWSLEEKDKKDNSTWRNTSHNHDDTLTGWTKANLVLKPNVLNKNTEYRLNLTAKNSTMVNGSLTVYKFSTSRAPRDGECYIRPEKGNSETEFRVLCRKWTADSFPLTYFISYNVSVGKSSVSILWYYGYEQTSPRSKLPPGPDNKKLNVSVRIQEKFGGYTTRYLPVEVKLEPFTTETFKKSLSRMKKINVANEPQKLTQLVTLYSTILDEHGDNITVEDGKLWRFSLVELLSKLDATTLADVKQTADAVQLATHNPKQVTYPTQDSAVATLKKLSLTLHDIATDPSQRSGQDIDETAQTLCSVASVFLDVNNVLSDDIAEEDAGNEIQKNVYGTASKAGQKLEQVGREMKKVVTVLDQVISNVSSAILGKKLVGEVPTNITTENFDMELSNNLAEENKSIIQYVNDNIKGFRLPQSVFNTSSGNYRNIYTRFVKYKGNPYVWDIEKSAFIQPELLSLSFTTENNQPVPVRNLSKDIEIFLSNNISHEELPLLEISKDDERFLIYNFRVREHDFQDTIMIEVVTEETEETGCDLSQAKFFVKFGAPVSPTSFDFSRQLFENSTDSNSSSIDIHGSKIFIREPKKLELKQRGVVSIGILPCPAEDNWYLPSLHKKFASNKYKVYVRSLSCRYWDPATSKWEGAGCRVGPNSTQNETQCLCNHLTTFSSYIVKPNPLTKFSTDAFEEGYALFVAVTVVFLLYFLILIWARKADRADVTKVGVCALSDNNPRDRYRYEIAVWTGMRRNAGTESEVSVIISGDISDSKPRRLVNPNTKGLKRGSLEKFLLTTPEDLGGLYCIRIGHDNSKGSWYLSRVMVTDLESGERYYFICDRWLAVDEDNGAIERLLPVASDEELTDFYHLFYSRTKRNLSDTHLWISVLNRPPQSVFTRVQRLSCCLCVLMMTMVTNAMFYGQKSDPKQNATNFIGSYSFTFDEVFIGVISSLIVFPANMIILYIFRHVRPKPVKPRRQSNIALLHRSSDYKNIRCKPSLTPFVEIGKSSSPVDEEKISITTDGKTPLVAGRKKKNKIKKATTRWSRIKECLPRLPSSLPHWFLYFAWFLVVILTLASGTVVIIYGMQFGNGRSLKWLFSIIVSICEDIFVLQPLKVLGLALVFALLVRKPDEGEFNISRDEALQDDEEFLVGPAPSPGAEHKVRSPEVLLRPDEHQLKAMRRTRMKERKMFGLIQEIIVHLLYIIVIYLVTYGHKDTRAINLSQHLNGSLSQYDENNTVYEITDFPALWNWSRVTLIPLALPDEILVPTFGFFKDRYNYMISRARLRLLRVAKDSCPIPKEFKNVINVCGKDYSIFDQDEACYDKRWKSTTWKKNDMRSRWYFQSSRNLDGYPTWGLFTTYSGSGYITELVPGKDNNGTATKMEKLDWLDQQSRALFVEFTTYNANVNLYTSIMLLFEFPSYGGIFLSRHIQPMRLKVYVGGFAFFIFVCEVVFLLFTAAYLYLALKKIYRNGLSYLKTFWNIIDLGIVLVSFAAIGVYIYRIGLTTKLMRRVTELDGSFVNFQYVTYWNEMYNCVIAFVVALATLKLTKLMRFNLRISLFGKTLKHARLALMLFSVQFGIVFIAYVMVGVLVFGSNVARFKSIPTGIMSLLRVILGKSEFTELFQIDPVIGPLFFFTFVFFVTWVLTNMFLAILIDAYHEVQIDCGAQANEYEMMDFFLAKFRAWSGMGKAEESIDPRRRWQKARMKVKAAKELGRRHGYQPSAEDVELEKTGDLMERFEDTISRLEKRVHLLTQDD